MRLKQRIGSLATAFLTAFTCFLGGQLGAATHMNPITASAASADYPAQLVRISTADNSKNLNITGFSDNSSCNVWTTNGEQNENWRFDYVGTNSNGSFYKITNMGTGRLLTPKGYNTASDTPCVIYGSESHTSQHWYVIPVSKDNYGNDLYYKIVNYDAPDMAVTYHSTDGTISLSAYNGSESQKWLINTAGLQGFAGYAKDMSDNPKASDIGGLLGETVEVSTFDELKAACTAAEPKTIIITSDISGKNGSDNYEISTGYDGGQRYYCRDNYIYLQPNKTIIGSYSAHNLYNVYFRTYNETYGPGHDIIIRNIDCTHDTELNTDNIWEFAYGWNFWIDHCDLEGHKEIETSSLGSDDWDKFLNFKGTTDFATVSDCTFGHHEYGVLMGYPTDTQEIYDTYHGTPCITLADNYYNDTITRAPGLMRYGYFHSLNNYVVNFDMGYTIYTASNLYSESNYFDAGTGKGSVVNDTVSSSDISATYPGKYTDSGSVLVNQKFNFTLEAKTASPCTWRPSENYAYTAKNADEAKAYCLKNAGSQSSKDAMTYAAFRSEGVPSAGYVTKTDADAKPDFVTGDVNEDGAFNVSDVVALQKWLLAVPDATLKNWKAGDLCEDDIINVFDLCLMRRLLITSNLETDPSTEQTYIYEPADFKFSGNVYLVGDSTVCDYDENYSIPYNRYGWGMKLAEQFNGVTVHNLALAGRSSRSFLEEQNYQTLCKDLSAGDYLFIQFGHNDEKTDETLYPGLGTYAGLDMSTLDNSGKNSNNQYSFEWMILNKYVKVAQEKGAVPVIITPITRRGTDGTANYAAHTAYQQGLIELGKQNNVAVLDMTTLTTNLYTNLYNYGGAEETAKMHCYADTEQTTIDNTHLSNAGAYKIANMIANETKKYKLQISGYIKQ